MWWYEPPSAHIFEYLTPSGEQFEKDEEVSNYWRKFVTKTWL